VSWVSRRGYFYDQVMAQTFVGSKVVVDSLGRYRQAAVTANHGPSWWGPRKRHEAGQLAVADAS
jgi:hypothetical protein